MLKLQYFGQLMQISVSLEKTMMLERFRARGEGGDRGWLDSITDSMDMNLSKVQETVKDREAWHTTVHQCANR